MFLTEGFQFGTFLNLLATEPKLQKGLFISGLSLRARTALTVAIQVSRSRKHGNFEL